MKLDWQLLYGDELIEFAIYHGIKLFVVPAPETYDVYVAYTTDPRTVALHCKDIRFATKLAAKDWWESEIYG